MISVRWCCRGRAKREKNSVISNTQQNLFESSSVLSSVAEKNSSLPFFLALKGNSARINWWRFRLTNLKNCTTLNTCKYNELCGHTTNFFTQKTHGTFPRNEVKNASFAQRSAHRDSRIWRPELIEPAAERKRHARMTTDVQIRLPWPTDFATVQYFVQLPPIIARFCIPFDGIFWTECWGLGVSSENWFRNGRSNGRSKRNLSKIPSIISGKVTAWYSGR